MARIDIIIPDELEQRFREEVFKRLGMKKRKYDSSCSRSNRTMDRERKKLR